jgi:hypothetical protein
MADELSQYYAGYLTGAYDCVDRIVLNGYFQLAHSPGGFRTWWRTLKGSDADWDNAHLMRMAGRVSRRVRAYAQAQQIPLIDCKSGERKDELAQSYLPTEPDFVGVFLILVGRVPAPVWDVKLSAQGKIRELARKPAQVNHYAFHVMDREWGHVIFKMCGHPSLSYKSSSTVTSTWRARRNRTRSCSRKRITALRWWQTAHSWRELQTPCVPRTL